MFNKKKSCREKETEGSLVHLLRLLNDLFVWLRCSWFGLIRLHVILLVLLEAAIRLHDAHLTVRPFDAEAKVRLIKHLDSQSDAFRLEVHDEGFSLEFSMFVGVHFDALFAVVGGLSDDAVTLEKRGDFVKCGVERDRSDIDGGISLF